MKNMRTKSGLLFGIVTLMVFMGGCISNDERGYGDSKPVIPGFSWSKRAADERACYGDAGGGVHARFRANSGDGHRGYRDRKAWDYFDSSSRPRSSRRSR